MKEKIIISSIWSVVILVVIGCLLLFVLPSNNDWSDK